MEEIAHARIVAVAQNSLALKIRRVMLQFLFDIGKLGVKLVLLRRLRSVHAPIQRVGFQVAGVFGHWSHQNVTGWV